MLTSLLLALWPVPLTPEFMLLTLAATLVAVAVLMVTKMMTGEQT